MPHYANGREAQLDDLVLVEPKGSSTHTVGILIGIHANQGSCNATILPLARRYSADGRLHPVPQTFPDCCVSLSECSHLFPERAEKAAP